jgi:hypothetical protein
VFEAGQWYTLPIVWCDKIKHLQQESGAPYFQIMEADAFNDTARKEMMAAMQAAGLSGLAAQGALPNMPATAKHKDGPRPSAFAGMDKAVSEVALSNKQESVAEVAKSVTAVEPAKAVAKAPRSNKKAARSEIAESPAVTVPVVVAPAAADSDDTDADFDDLDDLDDDLDEDGAS